jgi:hypothetical protein
MSLVVVLLICVWELSGEATWITITCEAWGSARLDAPLSLRPASLRRAVFLLGGELGEVFVQGAQGARTDGVGCGGAECA